MDGRTPKSHASRRQFLRLASMAAGATALAACVAPTPQVVTEVVKETVVVKEVVEKTVKETVQVEKTVKETVQVENVVTATPSGKAFLNRKYTLFGLQYDVHVGTYNKVAGAYEALTGARCSVEAQDWPIEAKVIATMAAGNPPDVVCIMGTQLRGLIDQGALVDVGENVYSPLEVDPAKVFTSGSVGCYMYDDKHWGVPTEDGMLGQAVTVRTDWLEKAGDKAMALWPLANGKEEFDTYEQMWDLAGLLQESQKDAKGNVAAWGLSSAGHASWAIFAIMKQLGKEWWDPKAQRFNMDSAEARKALELFVTIPVLDRKIEVAQAHHTSAFVESKIAMSRAGLNTVPDAITKGLEAEGCIAPCATPGKTAEWISSGGWGYVATTQGKNKDIAVDFLKFMCTEEPQKIWVNMYGGDPPAMVSLLGDPVFEGDDPTKRTIRRLLKTLPHSTFGGSGPWMKEVVINQTIEPITELIRAGEKELDEGLAEIQQKCMANMEEYLKTQQKS